MNTVRVGKFEVGDPNYCFVIAEIGINHNGSIELAEQLIRAAKQAGCDAVKFQKRTIDIVYTPEELARPRESPFGTTNGDLKRGLELGVDAYDRIDRLCRELNILWFASCWDEPSVDFMERYEPPCYKIASACLTDRSLLQKHRSLSRPLFMSTGMSTFAEIDRVIEILGGDQLVLMHCISTYPADVDTLNLNLIPILSERYQRPIGYSGHEIGLYPSLVAVALGACSLERHITLSRAMFGSDQSASVEPSGIARLLKDLRQVPAMLGNGVRDVHPSEAPIKAKLRRIDDIFVSTGTAE
jgi:N-acetylneuraminate synthase